MFIIFMKKSLNIHKASAIMNENFDIQENDEQNQYLDFTCKP
jgi:hypothetical protein